MMGAGVTMKSMVAGVAMGLLLDETGGGGEPIILTDILGSEDALGTMDFKVFLSIDLSIFIYMHMSIDM